MPCIFSIRLRICTVTVTTKVSVYLCTSRVYPCNPHVSTPWDTLQFSCALTQTRELIPVLKPVPVVQVQVYRGYGYGYIAGTSTGHTHSTRGLPGLFPSSGARYTIVAVAQPSRKGTCVGEKATNHNGEALLYVFSDDISVKGVDSSDGDEMTNIHRKLTPR